MIHISDGGDRAADSNNPHDLTPLLDQWYPDAPAPILDAVRQLVECVHEHETTTGTEAELTIHLHL